MTPKEPLFLVPRAGEGDQDRQFREAFDAFGAQAMRKLDAAIELRTATPEVQRERHRARGALRDALVMMQSVHDLHTHLGPAKPNHFTKPRS